ncbi:MAG: Flp pilus assembly complex ATPase component TadA [Alphaproteobacteria bacterium]|uniref:Flp pilus assembly complex ATPase component TadA n=1 Tax=Candidatus Nitrobium versatile TaxID=2884831 RepID=A0A953SHP7_9BACT|nr:Flp pilus assembly complex ATPase component TadA [Candidatus Nitrobium versatile]
MNMKDLTGNVHMEERISAVMDAVHAAKNFDEIMIGCKEQILGLVNADRLTLYAVDSVSNEIYSRFFTGEGVKEIRVPISSESLSGYAAFRKKTVNIKDAYNEEELKRIDPALSFNRSFDQKTGYRTRQVLVAPMLFNEELVGVIQLINKRTGEFFTEEERRSVEKIASKLAIAFRNQIERMLKNRLGYLVIKNIIPEQVLDNAASEARREGKDLSAVLLTKGVSRKDLGEALSLFYGCRFVEFDENCLLPLEVQKDRLKISYPYLRKAFWAPIGYEKDEYHITIDDPKHIKTSEISTLLPPGRKFKLMVSLKEDILKFIDLLEKGGEVKAGAVKDLPSIDTSNIISELNVITEEEEEEQDSEVNENTNAIVRFVDQIIVEAYNKGASDIHIESDKGLGKVKVRYRTDGVCFDQHTIPYSHSSAMVSRIKILSSLDISERRLPQSGKIKFKLKEKIIELRVEVTPTVKGENVVMRILASGKPMELEQLNLSDRNLEMLTEIVSNPYGIVLVVGPTGSGKTTTLHSVLRRINTPERKVWTAEDPVEITQEGLNQVQVNTKIGYTFAHALRSFLRADPDAVMIGEMRDQETAQAGIEASLTGHLVLSTLHTNNAPETIIRLIDIGIDPFNFADALLGVLAQRLVRTLCKECKITYPATQEEKDFFVNAYGPELFYDDFEGIDMGSLRLAKAKGCEKCNNTGYKGRTGIHEILSGTKEVKMVIQRKGTAEEIRRQAVKDGMRTLHQDGIRKVLKGQTDYGQVRSVCMTT